MLGIVAAMVLVLASGVLPAPVGVLIAAMAVVAAGILTVPQAYRAIDWNTVVLVAAMIPLSTAMYRSGAASQMADVLVAAVGEASPATLIAGLFLLTALLGKVISNTANVAASAAFLSPIATPSNLIVMGPGGYRFGDYWKLGLAMMALYFAVAVFWVPLVWRP
jgi:di/tricarboxylate transporter